jgi:hypothetical protein
MGTLDSKAAIPTTYSKPKQGQRKSKSVSRALRLSMTLNPQAPSNLHEAALFSWSIGLPLNKMLTIHMQKGGVEGREALEALQSFLQRVQRWLRKHGIELSAIWVRENGIGEGEHVHMLLHIPVALMPLFPRMQARWLKQSGVKRRKNVVRSRMVAHNKRAAETNPELYRFHLSNTVDYLRKATEPGQKGAGPIVGKRCGTTQNIGLAARCKHSLKHQ